MDIVTQKMRLSRESASYVMVLDRAFTVNTVGVACGRRAGRDRHVSTLPGMP